MDGALNGNRWSPAIIPAAGLLADFPELKDHPLTHFNLATAYYRKQDYEKSLSEWKITSASMPDEPYPLTSLGMVCFRMEKYDQAEDYARKAIAIDPDSSHAHDVLGLALFKQGKILESLRTMGRALKGSPKEDFIRDHYLQVRGHYIKSKKAQKNLEAK